jgi:hypothetical protein
MTIENNVDTTVEHSTKNTFNAAEALRITTKYIAETRQASSDWIAENMRTACKLIEKTASTGLYTCKYKVDLDIDDDRDAKMKFLFDELITLNFRVDMTEQTTVAAHKRWTIYNISWASS